MSPPDDVEVTITGSFEAPAVLQLISPNFSTEEIEESDMTGWEIHHSTTDIIEGLGTCSIVEYIDSTGDTWPDLEGENQIDTIVGQISLIVNFE